MGGIINTLAVNLSLFASTTDAINTVHNWVLPTVQNIASLAAVVAVIVLIYAGYVYMTSTGKPEHTEAAKNIAKKAMIGLVIILAAIALTSIISNAYGTPQNPANAAMPNLQAIEPKDQNSALVEMVINTITGFLKNIINGIASPFLGALDFFTKSTPAMASNKSVFNFWLAMVGIADVLFILVLVLVGFHTMTASALGFDEIDVKTLLPRLLLIFAVMNSSIFLIDGIIALSNVLITAVGQLSGSSSIWSTLTEVVEKTSGLGMAALIIMIIFVFFSVVLLVYYVMRLVTLYLGAVLSPLVALLWLVPSFRDFAETAFKTYITTIFVLFIHVIILQLASALFVGMATTSGEDQVPNTLMAMVTGIATIIMLLKAQGTMMQFSYVSMGARNIQKMSSTFINGVSSLTNRGKSAVDAVKETADSTKRVRAMSSLEKRAVRTGKIQSMSYENKKGTAEITHTASPKTAPKVKVTSTPTNNSKDKTT